MSSGRDTDGELDVLIQCQAKRNGGRDETDALEEMWATSERRDREHRRRETRALWYAFHMRLSEARARISEEHEAKALALLEDPTKR